MARTGGAESLRVAIRPRRLPLRGRAVKRATLGWIRGAFLREDRDDTFCGSVLIPSMPPPRSVSAQERRAWMGRVKSLSAFADSSPLDEGALARTAVDMLQDFARAPAAVYRPERHGEGYRLALWFDRGLPVDTQRELGTLVSRRTRDIFLFEPTRPQRVERNVVRSILPVENAERASETARLFVSLNMDRLVQTRMLVCAGPLLLAWTGVFREGSRVDNLRDAWLVRTLGRALRRPLRLLRQLPPPGDGALFEAALEALEGEAYLVTRAGSIECANGPGAARLAAGLRNAASELVSAIELHERGVPTLGLAVHPVRDRNKQLYLVHRPALRNRAAVSPADTTRTPTDLETRLLGAAARWRATRREVDVLRRLVLGDANKEIAARLSIHEGSVERHTTSLLRKAGCDSRTRLVARFWCLS